MMTAPWHILLSGSHYPAVAACILSFLRDFSDVINVTRVFPNAFSAPDYALRRLINRLKSNEDLSKDSMKKMKDLRLATKIKIPKGEYVKSVCEKRPCAKMYLIK